MKYIFTLLFVALVIQVSGQSIFSNYIADPIIKGDKLYDEYAYADAIKAYHRALEKNPESDTLKLKIAASYKMLNDPANAVLWYKKVLGKKKDYEAYHYLNYAEVLSATKQYAEAKIWYDYYGTKVANDERVNEKISAINSQEYLFRNESNTTVKKASFNGGGSDFSPAFFGNELVFVSSRESENNIPIKFLWDNSEYLDLYILKESGEVVKFDNNLDSEFHEGPLVFYDDNTKIIFTRNNYIKGKVKSDNKGVTKLKLYAAEYMDSSWTAIKPLPFNSDEYSVGHPAITKDGKTLFFASDMPGGEGGTDLYMASFKNGSWGKPQNLGSNINTKGNEMFPFLHQDKNLFFASNGHGGLGGLDIFGLDVSEDFMSKVINVGSPINSNLDDFGIILEPDGLSGYFSSNKEKSLNHDDIYEFITTQPLLQSSKIKGIVIDRISRSIIPNTEIKLIRNDSVIATTMSDAEGNYSFAVEPNIKYEINAGGELDEASAKSYLPYETEVVTLANKDNMWEATLELLEDHAFEVFLKVTDKTTNQPISDVDVIIIDNISGDTISNIQVDPMSEYTFSIDDKELNDRISYQIILAKEGYLGKSLVYNKTLSTPGRIDIGKTLDLTLDKIDIGTDIGKLIDIQPIYFDLGKSTIRDDAAIELDKIVKIMNENPTITIELGSHTDARGNSASNLRLSDRRAKSSADYIISQGIDKARIIGKGYGEANIINRCVDGVKCSEDEHQLNRRTEFKITSF